MRAKTRSVATLVLLALALFVGCDQSATSGSGAGVDPAQWAALQEAKTALDAKRAELRALQAEVAAMPPKEEGEEAAGEGEAEGEESVADDPAVRLAHLESDVATLTEQLGADLVTYINALQIPQGAPLTPDQQAAMRMKSDEDMELAREWIEKGGDYRRAIDIYESQLVQDPDYPALQAALEKAKEMRYMTEERFAAVKKNMTREEVRGLLGPVNLQNIREFPEKEAVGWFYPKDNGGAAGIYFKLDKKKDAYLVYDINFEAVKPRVIEADGSETVVEDEEG